jgi:desulfoferrodoxin (superoxide reductase-like protein)
MWIMNKLSSILVLILLALSLPAVFVYANVPSVLSITHRTEGVNTVIDVKVSHANPSDTHYIASISLDHDGTQKTFTDLTKATANEATYSLNIGTATPKIIKAQATCILHGTSSVFTENATPGTTGGIPGYPLETMIIGSTLAIWALITANKKR